MMLDDPIRELVDSAPTAVVIQQDTPDPAGYSPGAVYAPGAPTPWPVDGFLGKDMEGGVDLTATATFTIHVDDLPAGLEPATLPMASLTFRDQVYAIAKVGRRYWEGDLNGYTLVLAL